MANMHNCRTRPMTTRNRRVATQRSNRFGPIWSNWLVAAILLIAQSASANEWARMISPSHGAARSIGITTNGCVAGAVSLPKDGSGYHVMHLERRRNFGHPALIQEIQTLGRAIERERLGVLHVGDLAQPRGGPTPFGHRSHQTGIDVDVWFTLSSTLLGRADPLRSNLFAPSLLNDAHSGLNRMLWESRHQRVLELVSRSLRVDRIFVNPHIKRELCRTATGDRSWLRKIRPWWGHDDHFHARLTCPSDSPDCNSQDPVPSGDGCDSSLDWWLRLPSTLPSPGPKAPRTGELSRMPDACRRVLMD